MSAQLAPQFVIIDDFLPEPLIKSLEHHVPKSDSELELMDLGGTPEEGHYAAVRRLWVSKSALGDLEGEFSAAVLERLDDLCAGTGITPFPVARVETEVCVQRNGSFFAKHVDTDTREPGQKLATDRMISAVFYFPREPLAFAGGELVLYDFTGRDPSARIAPKRNRLVAFPSFAYHAVTQVNFADDSLERARWSVNCWLHRARST